MNNKLKIYHSDIIRHIVYAGIPLHLKGYKYLCDAIEIALKNRDSVNSITKDIYPVIANRYETSSGAVERGIRNAISIAWKKDPDTLFNEMLTLDEDYSRKPTNSQFIAGFTERLRVANMNL